MSKISAFIELCFFITLTAVEDNQIGNLFLYLLGKKLQDSHVKQEIFFMFLSSHVSSQHTSNKHSEKRVEHKKLFIIP